ncbi:MAG: EpsI family protein [Woeseiaceae bacterium]|nr:EpsI family protein [Woeseiaceae bacterium]
MRDGLSFPEWRRTVLLVAVVAAVMVALFWPSVAWLLEEWGSSNSEFEHGIPVLLVAAVLTLLAAARIPAEAIRPYWPALLAVGGLSLAWLLAKVANVANAQTLVLPFALLAAFIAILGVPAGRKLAPGVLYAIFALPAWQVLKPVLRDITVVAVEGMLKLGGVPAVIEGSLVHIASGTFKIANGCSGLNFFVVGFAISALYGYLFYKSWQKRAVLLAVGIGLAVLGNWIRVATIITIGEATEMQSGLIEDHQNFGWLLFAGLQVPFFAIAMWLGRNEPHESGSPADGWAGARLPRGWPVAAAVALAVLAAGPIWAMTVANRYPVDAAASPVLPADIAGWNGPARSRVAWQPDYEGVSGQSMARYDSPEGAIWMYGNVYLSQDQGRELVYIHNRIGGDAPVRGTDTSSWPRAGGGVATVRLVDIEEGFRSRRIAYWYQIDGRRYVSDTRAKIAQALATLAGKPEAGVVAVSALCDVDCEAADARIVDFVTALGQGYRMEYTNMDDSLQ